MSILTIKNLVKIYKKRFIVNNISIILNSKEIVGLLGPNGAGKTTTFYMILGIIKSDSGNVILDNEDISLMPLYNRAKRGIGYLPQETSIFRQLNVFDNIMSILQIRNDINNKQRKIIVNNLMNEFNIEHLHNVIGNKLSGGECRRVEIARALAANPKFILLDEPFAGIDPISINDIKSIIKHLCRRGLGVLITDHNVRDTLSICQRAYIINRGNLIAHGTPTNILHDDQVKNVYLGDNFRF